jgi:hypothetical protein
MDAGALDDLDLDDMFNDDGDMLFEGLDIELDGTMGDIISNEKTNNETPHDIPPVTVVPPRTTTNKRSGGPRTKRTNPHLEKANDEKGNKSTDTATTTSTNTKRRKTKRKSKAPAAFGDDDDDGPAVVEEQPKKKRKSTKTKKGTATTEVAATVIATTTTTTTTKKRKKKSGDILPAYMSNLVHTTASTGIVGKASILPTTTSVVAAAGQFGGRVKKVGTTKIKRKIKKSSIDGTSEHPAPAPPPILIRFPKAEPTFGGLKPSKQFFYPFLDGVPIESGMPKRKAYPVLDRFTSTLTSTIVNTTRLEGPNAPPVRVTEDHPIFKLMLETYEEDGKPKFPPEKRIALLKGVSQLRKMIDKSDKNDLVRDIVGICGLLTREYNFLKITLDNMKIWCRDEFDDEKYNETYNPPIEQPKVSKWKYPVVRVKIAYNGYKEPKNSQPLFAILPAMVVVEGFIVKPMPSSTVIAAPKLPVMMELKKATSTTVSSTPFSTMAATPFSAASTAAKASMITNKKKRKEKVVDKTKLKVPPVAPQAPDPPLPKTYAESSPISRRQQIVERVSQLALELDNSQQREKMFGRLEFIPDEEPALHTTRMWEWLQSSGFHSKAPSSKRLAAIKAPEIHSRGPFQSIPQAIQGLVETQDQVSSNALFDRLQSLLVEENGGEDDDDDDGDEEDSLGFLDDDDDDMKNKDTIEKSVLDDPSNLDYADLSELSIEERTFIHLSNAGLIKKSLYPKVKFVASNAAHKDDHERDEIDLGNVIGEMSTDLTRITSTNNTRISFLETMTSDADAYYCKQVEEEQAALIVKCQNLLKRNKEKAKKAKQKNADNLNLPW